MHTNRFAAVLAGLLLAGGAALAHAQAWPAKPVTIVVPFPPGSGNDIIARVLAPNMSNQLGQSMVIDNKAGASSNIGMEFVAKAAPDGYTVALASSSYAINIYTLKGTQPLSAYTPVALIGKLPFVLWLNAQVPARNVQELITLVRANKGKYNAAAGGPTGTGYFAVESFKRFVGPELELVVYKGTPEAETDLFSGRVHMIFGNVATALPHYRSGKVKLLAIGGDRRSSIVPEVPTFNEQGFPQLDSGSWYALLGPAGIPRPAVARFNEAANKALAAKEVLDKLAPIGLDVAPGTPEEADAFLKADSAVWARRIKEAGVGMQ